MAYFVRKMRGDDVAAVTEIDREAFPTQWPPPNYKRELQSNVAHYIVACEEGGDAAPAAVVEAPKPGLAARIRRLFRHDSPSQQKPLPAATGNIIGFAGLWVIADEAHITSIAVREKYRGRQIGELLLIAIVDLSARLKARTVTLEVRLSNTTAQNLYRKFGFSQAGVRRAYYTDNREDALLMSTPDISSAEYQQHFLQHKQSCLEKMGDALSQALA